MDAKPIIVIGGLLLYLLTRKAEAAYGGGNFSPLPIDTQPQYAYDPVSEQYYETTSGQVVSEETALSHSQPFDAENWYGTENVDNEYATDESGDIVSDNENESGGNGEAGGGMQPATFYTPADQRTKNLNAFLDMIVQVEANGDYGAIVGGGHTDDLREHPWVINPDMPLIGNSNASGGFQFIAATPRYPRVATWQKARDQAGVKDFSIASQRAAATVILKWRNAYADVLIGNFDSAIRKLPDEWEAFKLILAGKYPYTYAQVKKILADAGGRDTSIMV